MPDKVLADLRGVWSRWHAQATAQRTAASQDPLRITRSFDSKEAPLERLRGSATGKDIEPALDAEICQMVVHRLGLRPDQLVHGRNSGQVQAPRIIPSSAAWASKTDMNSDPPSTWTPLTLKGALLMSLSSKSLATWADVAVATWPIVHLTTRSQAAKCLIARLGRTLTNRVSIWTSSPSAWPFGLWPAAWRSDGAQ
jgi:hypothetical protein